MTTQALTTLLSQVGFPIVVTLYLLKTTNKKLDNLVSVVDHMAGMLEVITKSKIKE